MFIPMPDDLRIVPPGPDVAPIFARFSGAWGNGAWGGISPVALAVERVGSDGTVDIVYAFGACAQFGFEARWRRRDGFIADGRLRLDEPASFTAEFTLGDDGVLVGRFTAPEGYQARVWLDRVPGRNSETLTATLGLPRRPPWQELRIPVRSAVGATAGHTLQLQAFHYPTKLFGRQPLVVLNHGSTDSERPGVPCIYPFEPEARFFLARGCSVLALMRKPGVARTLAKALAEQHTCILEADVAEWLPTAPTWPPPQAALKGRLPLVVDDADLRRRIDRLLAAGHDLGTRPQNRALVHADFGLHNVAFDPATGAVNGVFDYAGAAWADGHLDFRYLVFAAVPDALLDTAMAAYRDATGVAVDRRRILTYNAMAAVGHLADRVGHAPDDVVAGRTLAGDLRRPPLGALGTRACGVLRLPPSKEPTPALRAADEIPGAGRALLDPWWPGRLRARWP